ncbi:hypothetical protein FHG87_016353 [Trinorchestia longiramus]|nr:hypothetical protein FHG87_016353 [Trinorchestia longiramus]
MTKLMITVLSLLATTAVAYPRYVAIPLEDLSPAPSGYQPVYLSEEGEVIPDQKFDGTRPVPAYLAQPTRQLGKRNLAVADSERVERGSGHHHGDIVDYGAYTGGHGAFGWYTDHPVHGHH